jgi:hypothetical protein
MREVAMDRNRSRMGRVAAIFLLLAAGCAHDRALDRREVAAMENASPAISPWAGPPADPIAANHD